MVNGHSEFHYSSTAHTAALPIVSYIGTASAGKVKKIRVTDLKVTCGAAARTIKIWGQGGHFKALEYDIPANGMMDLGWNMPYPIDAVSSTGVVRGIVASASGAGLKFSVSGYIEKYE